MCTLNAKWLWIKVSAKCVNVKHLYSQVFFPEAINMVLKKPLTLALRKEAGFDGFDLT